MKIISFERQQDGLWLETSHGQMKLTPYSPTRIRIRYTLEDRFGTKPSLIVNEQPSEIEKASYRVEETPEHLDFLTEALRIRIDKSTSAFSYWDADGHLLAQEPEHGGKTLAPVEVMKPVFDGTSRLSTSVSVDGVRVRADNDNAGEKRIAYRTKLAFRWKDGEALYGLGSHEEGVMNLRGSHQYLYQQNMKCVVPMFVSTEGYGILVDSCSLLIFRDDLHGSYIWTDADDEMDYYFLYGPEFDRIISGYRHLTGQAPLLPKWSFGYVQSKERYSSQEELISVVKEYRNRGIPLDLIVQDWQSWTNPYWGQKTLDPERFPDPKGMMDELHAMGAKLMISIWPIMTNDGPNQLELKQHGHLLGNQANYDAFQEDARKMYWRQTNEGLFVHGIDAWWCDCTEPFEADWTGAVKPEPEERLRINIDEAKKYLDPEYVNAFSLLHSQGIYEGQRSATDDKRVVNLTRSSYAGQQRYATITWSGDIAANWDTLRKQIPAGLNFCAAGLPYWTMDIGAFFVANREQWFWSGNYDEGCEDWGYRELYARWLQYGAFVPMFRSHGTDTPREVWRFGEPGTRVYETLVKFIRLRYRLLPYIYSLAGEITHEHYTIMRALPFDFRSDSNTYDIDDQYMFGPAFLVNPVTRPMYWDRGSKPIEGANKTRPVYLPGGVDWYDFWTGDRLPGGQTVMADAGLETMPLFVRAGSIVPMGPVVQSTGELGAQPYEIRIYAGRDGSFNLYEDEGDNYNYEKGECAWIELMWLDEERCFKIGNRNGEYPSLVKERRMNLILVGSKPGQGIGVAESAVFNRTVVYSGEAVVISFGSE